LGAALVGSGYWIKARKEESMLPAQFGEAFEEHRRHTGFLIPKFWGAGTAPGRLRHPQHDLPVRLTLFGERQCLARFD
jgi:hypothetical protein